MSNISRVKAAQTRAKKLIEQYKNLGWEIPESIVKRANMELPKTISTKKAQAMVDNLSKQTIDTMREMKQRVIVEETDPIVSSTRKSGARIYDVVNMEAPTQTIKDVTFSERSVVPKLVKEISFIMKNAPSRDIAEKIETRLWGIELHSDPLFTTSDRNVRQAALLQSLKSESEIKNAVKKAEKSGYPATMALTTLYEDLVGEYGTNEKGLAARQYRQFESVLESVGLEYSTDEGERQTAANVLRWLIENAGVWNSYRKQFKLKKIHRQTYDSNSLLVDVSDVLVDHPKYKMQILNKLIELMKSNTEPWELLDKLEEFVQELAERDDQNDSDNQ